MSVPETALTQSRSVASPGAVTVEHPESWTASAASESSYEIPSRFLTLLDVLLLLCAFLAAANLAPWLQRVLAADRAGRVEWLSWLSLTVPQARSAGIPGLDEVVWIPLIMIPATVVFMQLLGGYRPLLGQSRTRVLLSTVGAPLLGLSFVTLVVTAVRLQNTSRALMFSFALASTAGLAFQRFSLRWYKSRRFRAGYYARNVLVIAPSWARPWLAEHFAAHVSERLYRLFGFLDTAEASRNATWERDPQQDADGPPYMGQVTDLGELLVHRPIHEVLAVQGAGSHRWLSGVMEQCEYFRVTLRLVPEALLAWDSRDLSTTFRSGPLRLPEIVLQPRYLDSDALFLKRLIDIAVSAVLLVLLAPLFLVIAIAIKLTTPALPVFYAWGVVGYKGRPFTGYKFTTMQLDADDRKADLMHLNEMSGPVFKIKQDPRVTPLGRFLRKYSLNELPQLWSVLKGDMSLVGPRPAYPSELARYELWHKRKFSVQPGITCLWQIRGRNQISRFDDWVRMDFYYIDNWSLWLDVRILIRTVWVVLAGTGS